MFRYMALILLAIPLGAIPADDLTRTKRIKMQQYTVIVPASGGWKTERNKNSQTVMLQKTDKRRGTGVWIYVGPHDVSNMYATVHSKKWLGDDIRRREHANMIAMGVMTGMYELENVEKFEIDIATKHGYVMRYKQVLPTHVSDGYLFVYFPPDFDVRGIAYKFLYSSARDPSDAGDPDLTIFNFVVQNFAALAEG